VLFNPSFLKSKRIKPVRSPCCVCLRTGGSAAGEYLCICICISRFKFWIILSNFTTFFQVFCHLRSENPCNLSANNKKWSQSKSEFFLEWDTLFALVFYQGNIFTEREEKQATITKFLYILLGITNYKLEIETGNLVLKCLTYLQIKHET
jgi:hypothetical protein